MNPNNWFTVSCFCAIATLLAVSYGWLVKKEQLPFNSVMAFDDSQWQFMKIWVNIALLFGVIMPLVMWIIFWKQLAIRQFLDCYLLVVAIQLASEVIFSRLLCTSVVVIIGTLYTGFRIWQLCFGLLLESYAGSWFNLLWLVLTFWLANMIMLMTIGIPSILPQIKNKY